MVICAIYGCSKRSGRDTTSFYRIPTAHPRSKNKELIERRRTLWISRINRADLDRLKLRNGRICSLHFQSGKPSDLFDENNPDWAPCINLDHGNYCNLNAAYVRYERNCNRNDRKGVSNIPCLSAATTIPATDTLDCNLSCLPAANTIPTTGILDDNSESAGNEIYSSDISCVHTQTDVVEKIKSTSGTQTDLSMEDIEKLQEDWKASNKQLLELKKKIQNYELNEESYQDGKKLQFYTGINNFELFMVIFNFVEPLVQTTGKNVLSKFQECLLFFMRIRLNLLIWDLSYRFNIAPSSVSRIFSKWLNIMYIRLHDVVFWPSRDTLIETMPDTFKLAFGNRIAVIIDCFEVNCDRPTSLVTRAATWSNYKSHNTVKFLIGITPQGSISFISDAWGGRASDKVITENSGILENLLPGDWVLADRGFHVADSVGFYSARLVMPASLRNKKQLSPTEIQDTRKIASLRIHVERVIGLIKNKFRILKGTLPIEMLTTTEGETISPIDKIVRVCCALINLCPSVVHE